MLRAAQRSIFLQLFTHLGRAKWVFATAILLMMVDAACQIAVPMFFRYILNGLQADASGFMAGAIVPTVLLAIGLIIVFVPSAYLGHVCSMLASARLILRLRMRLYRHVQGLSADFHHRHHVGETSARINNDLEQASQCVGAMIGQAWAWISIVFAFAMMLWISPLLCLLFAGLFILSSVLTLRYMPVVRRMSRGVRDRAGDTSAVVTEFLSIQPLLKSFTYESAATRIVNDHANSLRIAHEKLAWRQFIYIDGMQLLLKFVAPFTLLLLGGWWVSQGSLKVGDLVAFWGYWLLLTHSMTMIFNGISMIFVGLAAADRVFEWLRLRPSVDDEEGASPIWVSQGKIEFQDVVFSYPTLEESEDTSRHRDVALNGFNLSINPGETVGLVGPSGAGKSTVLQLLMRFYDPDHGAVRIDGRDIRDVTQSSLRGQIGIVFQENYFMSGTIEENLIMAKPGASREQVIEALKRANAWGFVEQLPEQLDTTMGERGVRLSGGQKQRLAIARVFLKDPMILLLDEATSALDAQSETLVVEAMNRLLRGRTSLIVAHRIATIRHADRIVMVEAGRVAGDGPHERLRDEHVLYAQFCEQQCVA